MDERAYLLELGRRPLLGRIGGYFRLSGPGYLQSAMTLGGGSVASCVVMGSLVGYELLWVQPVAIALGYFVLASVAKQTCHSGERPYKVFWERLHPAFALLWGVSALVATVIWHFPQYSLTANGVVELAAGAGLELDSRWPRLGIGVVVLGCATAVVYLYTRGARGLKIYENVVKALVWGIVLAFAVVVVVTDIDWGRLVLGFTGITFFQMAMEEGISAEVRAPIIGGMAAAVGINMVFLYPYSLLAKDWGKEHKELAYFDLISGMVLPFLLATTFMMVATANTIGPAAGEYGAGVRDIRELVPVLGETFGESASLLIIGLGMTAIGFSTIITHMIACGFIGCEMFGVEHTGKTKWLFSMLPAIGMLGVIFPFPWYAAITASTLAFPLMPVAVVCFIVLLNKKSFMGDAAPAGGMKVFWNGILILAVVVMTVAAGRGLIDNWNRFQSEMFGDEESAAAAALDVPEDGDWPSGTFTHQAMGTDFEFVLYGPSPESHPAELGRIAAAAFDAIDDLEARISSWRPGSETSRVNREASERPVQVSPDVLELIEFSKTMHAKTSGAFDITVAPLYELWGFYRNEGRRPSPEKIAQALERVGMEKVTIDPVERTVSFSVEGMKLNYGGIGKGLALDLAAQVLRRYGVTRGILNGGDSSVLALDPPPGERHWTAHVRNPYNSGVYLDTIPLKNESFSTSGCYDRVLEADGREYCHIIDVESGYPVEGVLSVSVVGPSGAECDALSTAFVVMGKAGIEAYCAANPAIGAIFVAEPRSGPEIGAPEALRINLERTVS